ncbi:MAG TPA: hypothetical protein VIF34_02010 [Methylocystis sp.]
MKKVIAFTLSLAALSIGKQDAAAKPPRPQNAEVTTSSGSDSLAHLLKVNPAGGQPLAKAVEALLKGSYSAAPSVVALANRATPDQKAAIAAGYARALTELEESNQEGARKLREALSGADPTFVAMVASLLSQNYAEAGARGGDGLGGGGFSGGGFGGGGVSGGGVLPVSPN